METVEVDALGLYLALNIRPLDATLSALCRCTVLETIHRQTVQIWNGECKEAADGCATFVHFLRDSQTEDLERIEKLNLPQAVKDQLKKERKEDRAYFNQFGLRAAGVPVEIQPYIAYDSFRPRRLLAYWQQPFNFDYVDSLWEDYEWCTYKRVGNNMWELMQPPPLKRVCEN